MKNSRNLRLVHELHLKEPLRTCQAYLFLWQHRCLRGSHDLQVSAPAQIRERKLLSLCMCEVKKCTRFLCAGSAVRQKELPRSLSDGVRNHR